ncbi:MAG: DUF3857 domain-containing protein, partial [Bacteroidota bacterium]
MRWFRNAFCCWSCPKATTLRTNGVLLWLTMASGFCALGQSIPKAVPPTWVNQLNIPADTTSSDGAFRYLLLDFQDNLETEEYYVHYATQVFNAEGVQDFSDISTSYDPSYQSLTFHQVTIHRNGQAIDKLEEAVIKTLQRETSLERSLYDGSLTALINLSDVRKNDIIEYAYTVKGFNPINAGNYAARIYQQYSAPVNRIYSRVLCPNTVLLQRKALNNAPAPKITKGRKLTEYLWDSSGTDFLTYDSNVPFWLDFQEHTALSTFKDWAAVVQHFLPYYQLPDQPLVLPGDIVNPSEAKEARILKLIRFVQDEIRYLGFESGIGAYRPNAPAKVLAQRYGDCKDKSLLLCALLQQESVVAHPVLVSTNTRQRVGDYIASHNLFDHCIVHFEYDGQSFVVDPTIAHQGGDLKHMHTPAYNTGLLLKEGTKALTILPEPQLRPEVSIVETITTDSIGGPAIFLIESIYKGAKADEIRNYFRSNAKEQMRNEFLNFYSGLYPSVRSTDQVRFTDNARFTTNELKIEEYYTIEDFWNVDLDSTFYIAESQPMVLRSMIEYANSPSREMPYYLGEPVKFSQKTRISLPEYWNIADAHWHQEEPEFEYKRVLNTLGNTVEITHQYERKVRSIPGDGVARFIKMHDKIYDQLVYQLTYNKEMEQEPTNLSWISLLIILC